MLGQHCLVSYKHILLSNSETESDDNSKSLAVAAAIKKINGERPMIDRENPKKKQNRKGKKKLLLSSADKVAKSFKSKANVNKDGLVKLAKEYQKYMKKIPIPKARLVDAVAVNWQGLAKMVKDSYGQPLHYLTCVLCKQWDESRVGSEDGEKTLDSIIKWSSAEATIWKVEEIHRLCTSPLYLAKLWLSDPQHRPIVDEVIPSP